MRKLTECLIVLAFLLCAFTAQAASEIDVSVPSAGEPCSSDLQCDPGEVCVNDICSATRPCSNDLQCDSGELCIDNVCQKAGCETSEDCEEGLICASNKCVECLTWKDCDNETEICSDENTCVLADDCDLQIKPKVIKINKTNKFTITVNKDTDDEKVLKLYKAFKLTVKGNENFFPFKVDPVTGEPIINPGSGKFARDTTLDPLFIAATRYRWYAKNRMQEESVGVNKDQKSGFYTLQFGKCLGKITIENQNILPE